jgi:very-short-patch-repair endonuclease
MKTSSSSNGTALARSMRRRETDAERNLWSRLRNAQLGAKFRRQQPIGDYIVDFVCFDKKLIIEVDGGRHNEASRVKMDSERTRFLESRGFKVIRFWDNEVLQNIQGVGDKVLESLGIDGKGS